jgi:hypothetical protein
MLLFSIHIERLVSKLWSAAFSGRCLSKYFLIGSLHMIMKNMKTCSHNTKQNSWPRWRISGPTWMNQQHQMHEMAVKVNATRSINWSLYIWHKAYLFRFPLGTHWLNQRDFNSFQWNDVEPRWNKRLIAPQTVLSATARQAVPERQVSVKTAS